MFYLKYLAAGILGSCMLFSACQEGGKKSRPKTVCEEAWKDPDRDIDVRVADLLSRMTLEEKVSQMMDDSPPIERLGIPSYHWWSECLHGVARFGRATVFPQAIGLAATWDTELILRIGTAISDEGRAMFHAAQKKGISRRYGGLTYWTPNVNIFRDPRWGRGQETYGEDPFLTAEIGTSLVRGIQGDDPHYLKAGACGKHFVVHSGPEGLRHEFNALTSKKDLYETYLYAFHRLVDEGVESIMCAYNRTNGEACCGSSFLLKDILRAEWGFKGHIVSDCGALWDFYHGHGVSSDPAGAAALALKSGVNLNCGETYRYLNEAVERGLLSEEEIDSSLAYLLRSRFRLGLFDPPERVPFTSISPGVIHCEKHIKLSREAARKSIVMLKNRGKVLPLAPETGSIYIIGPNASNLEVLLGNYYGVSDDMATIVEGIAGKAAPGTFVQYRMGGLLNQEKVNSNDWATGGAKRADVIVAVMGTSPLLEGEEGESLLSPTRGDRLDIRLPANQVELLRNLRQGNEKPIVLVLTGGSPIDISEVEELADAILFVWYPGEQGGHAVADILFGDANPSGRLPITFPRSLEDLPPFGDYSMIGRTYRYMKKEPMYPFGFGLSYSQFRYEAASPLNLKMPAGEEIDIEVVVSNISKTPGEEVVQLYVSDLEASTRVPITALKDFRRVFLQPGDSRTIRFTLTGEMLELIGEDGKPVLEPGEFRIMVGACSPGSRGRDLGAPVPLEFILSLR